MVSIGWRNRGRETYLTRPAPFGVKVDDDGSFGLLRGAQGLIPLVDGLDFYRGAHGVFGEVVVFEVRVYRAVRYR